MKPDTSRFLAPSILQEFPADFPMRLDYPVQWPTLTGTDMTCVGRIRWVQCCIPSHGRRRVCPRLCRAFLARRHHQVRLWWWIPGQLKLGQQISTANMIYIYILLINKKKVSVSTFQNCSLHVKLP